MDEDIDFFKKKFNVSRETIEKLKIYHKFIVEKNKTLNLIGKNTEKSIFSRHFKDSAQIYDLMDKKLNIILSLTFVNTIHFVQINIKSKI